MERIKTGIRLMATLLFTLPVPGAFAQSWDWVQLTGGPEKEGAEVLAALPGDGLIVGGIFEGSLLWDVQTVTATGEDDIFLASLDEQGAPQWLISGGSPLNDEIAAIDVDPQGNIFCTGMYWFEGTFDGTTLNTDLNPKGIFLLKYDPQGQLIWAESLQGTALKSVTGMDTDEEGNVYLSGFFEEELHLQDSVLSAAGNTDLFLAKFTTEGELIWASRAGLEGDTRAISLVVGPGQTVYTAGFYNEKTAIGTDTLNANTSDRDVFVARFDELGQPMWARKAGGVIDDEVTAVALDPNGNLWVTGFLVGVMNLGDGQSIQSSNGNPDFYLLQYDEAGNVLQARAMGGDLQQQPTDILIDGSNVILSGFYLGAMTIDGFTLSAGDGIGGFVACFDLQAQARWIRNIEADQSVFPQALALDQESRLYTAGSLRGAAYFDGTAFTASGSFDIFLARTLSLTTAVDQINDQQEQPVIYPNPANGRINILTGWKDYRVVVYDPTGRKLLERENARTLDLTGAPGGLYLVILESAHSRFQQRIILTNE